jgi:hypothetical protein
VLVAAGDVDRGSEVGGADRSCRLVVMVMLPLLLLQRLL